MPTTTNSTDERLEARITTEQKRLFKEAATLRAKDADTATFYARYGFVAFPDQPLRLFLPMKTIGTLTES